MPSRSFSASSYRYGFNGKEKDDETVATGGGTQDYGMRIYNPALGRFLSVDPISNQYPELSTYQFASNSPISAIDLDGGEARLAVFGSGIHVDPITKKITESNHQAVFKKDASLNIEWKIATKTFATHTGKDLVSELKKATKDEGNIEYLSIYSHADAGGIILDNGKFGYETFTNQTWKVPGLTIIKTGLDAVFANGEIKFAPNALVVFGGCNAGNNKEYKGMNSIATKITEKYGIATIGAENQTAPTKDGRKSTNFVLNYKDENGKLQSFSLGKVLNKEAIEKAKNIVNDVEKKKAAATKPVTN
jgi:RHS repeat-associated protein